MSKLREAARDESCVACLKNDGTVILAHYTGTRRYAFDGGFGAKVHDLVAADLCARCHVEMDCLLRDKAKRWEHSELFLYYCMLTILKRAQSGVIAIPGERKPNPLTKIVPRKLA